MADLPDHLSVKTWLQQRAINRSLLALDELPADEVAAVIAEIYSPVIGPDETMPDWSYLVELEKRALAYLGDLAVGNDQNRRESVKKRRAAVRRRRRGVRALRREIWALAQKIESHYGRDPLTLLGLEGRRPVNPDILLDLARHIVTMLRSDSFAFPEFPIDGQLALDPLVLAADLEGSIERFEATAGVVEKQAAVATTALIEKRRAQRWAAIGRNGILHRLRSLLRMAGRDDFADRIVIPAVSRAADAAEPDPPVEPSTDPPDGEPPANL